MSFNNIYFEVLVYSSLIFFNILVLLGIIAVFYGISTISTIKAKSEQTLDRINDGASSVGEAGLNIASFVSQFVLFGPKRFKKSNFRSRVRDFFDER